MSEQARILLSVRGNTFEISGPESFVTAQVEAFRETIEKTFADAAATPIAKPQDESAHPPIAPHKNPGEKKSFPKILHIDGEKVQILKSLDGTTKSKKAVNTCLVYLWAKRQSGVDAVPFSELRDVCEKHGCLDPVNFSTTVKKAIAWIVVDGTKGSPAQTCTLTVPGMEKAESILKELDGAAA